MCGIVNDINFVPEAAIYYNPLPMFLALLRAAATQGEGIRATRDAN